MATALSKRVRRLQSVGDSVVDAGLSAKEQDAALEREIKRAEIEAAHMLVKCFGGESSHIDQATRLAALQTAATLMERHGL